MDSERDRYFKLSDLKTTLCSSRLPVILKNTLSSWKNIPRDLKQLREKLGDEILEFRISKNDATGLTWEGDAEFVKGSIQDFLDWTTSDSSEKYSNENPFRLYSRTEQWAYSSYNYMDKTFPNECQIMKDIDWSLFGFEGKGGKESVFWIGSPGAYTPCHMDTYGCNLVAQLIGRKLWILFPPDDALYPVRIPYEESSIFSSVDILNPDLRKFPLFQNCHPHVVVLEPGDILFVPSSWWHFVKNLDVSVSINTWIELDSDDDARLREAVTAMMMSFFIPAFDINKNERSWLNPNQDLMKPQESLDCIEKCLKRIQDCHSESLKTSDCDISPKVFKLETACDSNITCSNQMALVQEVKVLTFSEYVREICLNKFTNSELIEPLSHEQNRISVINCFVHPEVISCITKKLYELNLN